MLLKVRSVVKHCDAACFESKINVLSDLPVKLLRSNFPEPLLFFDMFCFMSCHQLLVFVCRLPHV